MCSMYFSVVSIYCNTLTITVLFMQQIVRTARAGGPGCASRVRDFGWPNCQFTRRGRSGSDPAPQRGLITEPRFRSLCFVEYKIQFSRPLGYDVLNMSKSIMYLSVKIWINSTTKFSSEIYLLLQQPKYVCFLQNCEVTIVQFLKGCLGKWTVHKTLSNSHMKNSHLKSCPILSPVHLVEPFLCSLVR